MGGELKVYTPFTSTPVITAFSQQGVEPSKASSRVALQCIFMDITLNSAHTWWFPWQDF